MATDKSGSVLRALIPLDHRMTVANIWDDESTYTQEGPRAGLMDPPADTRAVLRAHAEQATGVSYDIRGHRTGLPGPGDRAAGIVWRKQASPAEDWRGNDPPAVITAAEAIVWDDGTGSGENTYYPHALTLDDGTALVAYRWYDGTDNEMRCAWRNASTGGWTEVTVTTLPAPGGSDRYPCLVLLPDGAAVLFYWIFDATLNEAQVRAYISTDSGATWSLYQGHCLEAAVDTSTYTTYRLRGAYNDGQVLLCAHLVDTTLTIDAVIAQYASDSDGATFALVELGDGTVNIQAGGYPEVVAQTSGGFLIGMINAAGTDSVVCKRIGSAWQPLSTAEVIDVTSGMALSGFQLYTTHDYSDSDLAMCRGPSGEVYLLGRQPTIGGDPAVILRSTDEGATWAAMGQSGVGSVGATVWFYSSTSTFHARDFTAIAQGGRLLVCSNFNAGTTHDDSLIALYLGGHSTVTMPGYQLYPTATGRSGWEHTWIWLEDPATVGWTTTSTGAPTATYQSDGRRITTGGAPDTLYYTLAPSGTLAEGVIACAAVKVNSGGSTTTNDIVLTVRSDDGTNGYEIQIRATTTTLALVDGPGASTIATDATADPSSGVAILAVIVGAKCRVWYRPLNANADREWTLLGADGSLTDDSGSVGTNRIRWGHLAGSSAASVWRWELHNSDEFTGQVGDLQGFTNPDDLFPYTLGADPAWLNKGLKISMRDGPIRRSETWTLDPLYDYGIERAHPDSYPSPRHMWRGVDGSPPAQMTLAWRTGAAGWMHLTDSVAILAWGNWRTGELQGWDATAGAWETVLTLDKATGLTSIAYTRRHDCLFVDTGTSANADHWWPWGAYDGATVDLGGGTLRKVEVQTEGAWTDTTTKRPVLVIKDATNSEPVSGTLALWAPAVLGIAHKPRPSTAPYFHAWRLKVDSQTTVDGYLEAKAHIGPVIPLAHEYSWGRSLEIAPNVELTEWLDGTRFSRPLGPTRAAVEVAWIDGTDETQLYRTSPNPDYVTGTSAASSEPLGTLSGTPSTVQRLLSYLDGSHRPIVYAPNLTRDATTSEQILTPDRWMYGRVVSAIVGREVALGSEADDEVVRLTTVRIEEEV